MKLTFLKKIAFSLFESFIHLYNVYQSYSSTITSLQHPLVPHPISLPTLCPPFIVIDNLLNQISAAHVLIGWGHLCIAALSSALPCWLGIGFTWIWKIRYWTWNAAEAVLISLVHLSCLHSLKNVVLMEISRGENIFSCALASVEVGTRWNKKKKEHHFFCFILQRTLLPEMCKLTLVSIKYQMNSK